MTAAQIVVVPHCLEEIMKLKSRIVAAGVTAVMAAGVAFIGAPAASAADGAQVDHLGEMNHPFAPSADPRLGGQAGVGWLRGPDGSIGGMSNDQTFGSPAAVTLDDNVDTVRAGETISITVSATNTSTFARGISMAVPSIKGVTATAAESTSGTPILSNTHVFVAFDELDPGETGTIVIDAKIGNVPAGTKLPTKAYVYQTMYGPSSQIVDTDTVVD
ncbi:hypothetical protein MOX01_04080 [Microbacterium oxydans]|nr:hypothetical protein MOX01_04080 [Microbacterium oxydans]